MDWRKASALPIKGFCLRVWNMLVVRAVAAGLPANGKPRFGYRYDHDAKMHVPDEAAGPVLAEVYRRYVAGESVYALTRWLNTTGLEPASGYGPGQGVWQERTLRRVLDSGFGAGFITVKGERHPGAHTPVIGEDLWVQYLEARQGRARPSGKGRHQYTLTGLCWCGVCGSRMAAETDSDGRARLRCRAVKTSGAHSGGWASHELVLDDVKAWLTTEAAGVGDGAVVKVAGARRRDWEAEKQAVSERLLTATRQHLAGVIPEDAYVVVRDEFTAEFEALERMRVEAAASDARPVAAAQARSLLEDWDALAADEAREVLRRLIDRVVVTPGRPRARVEIFARSL